jgi:hypothetical protein
MVFLLGKFQDRKDFLENNQEKITDATTANINGYQLVLTTTTFTDGGSFEQKLQIFKKDKLEFEATDLRFSPLKNQYDFETESPDLNTAEDFIKYTAKDITGDKIPELSFVGWSGGAHCCFTAYVIELSDIVSVLWNFNTEDSSAEFVDINEDGIMEIETSDSVLRYWHINFADSPFPYVILTYDKKLKKYIVNQDMMRKPAPSRAEIEKRASPWTAYSWQGSDCKGTKGECAPWSYAVYLIYSGNAERAWEYIDLAWRDNEEFKSKEDFLKEFKETLKSSSYYSSLLPLTSLDN